MYIKIQDLCTTGQLFMIIKEIYGISDPFTHLLQYHDESFDEQGWMPVATHTKYL